MGDHLQHFPQDAGGGNNSPPGDTAVQPPTDLTTLLAEMDLLRLQASNIQSQLDRQLTINTSVSTSIDTVQHELQTLRGAFTTNFDN